MYVANPTISYGHALQEDCDSLTGWSANGAHEFGLTATMTTDGSRLRINATAGASGYAYYEKDVTNFSTDTYPEFLVRYYTQYADTNAAAKVEVVFTSGTQVIMDSSYFTSQWGKEQGTLTAAKTVDKLRLYVTTKTGSVYFDSVLLDKGPFTFPYVNGLVEFEFPNTYAYLTIPGRVGSQTQWISSESIIVRVETDMEMAGGVWGDPRGINFMDIWHEAHNADWCWFTSDIGNLKVTPTSLKIRNVGLGGKPRAIMEMREYRATDASGETIRTRIDKN